MIVTMSSHLSELVVVYSAYILITVSPGPANLSIMALSMSHGRRAGMSLAFGVIMGSFTWAVLAGFGVSTLLTTYADLLIAIKLLGGLYLLYLGIRFGRSALLNSELANSDGNAKRERFRHLFFRGYLIHLTNPKAILGWTAIIALGLKPSSGMEMIFEIIGGCLCLGVIVFGSYALIFSSPLIVRVYIKAKRGIEATLAAFFIFAGLKMLTQKL